MPSFMISIMSLRPVAYRVSLDDLDATVTFKPIKRLRLRVQVPTGALLVSAPSGTSRRNIERFILAHHDWIKEKRADVRRNHVSPDGLVSGAVVPLWGEQRVLSIQETRASISRLNGEIVELGVRQLDPPTIAKQLDRFYRVELEQELLRICPAWESRIAAANKFRFRRMTSRWGSCQPATRAITLNISLAERDPRALEYVLVHELTHLREANHGARFYQLLETWLPDWRERKGLLSQPSK